MPGTESATVVMTIAGIAMATIHHLAACVKHSLADPVVEKFTMANGSATLLTPAMNVTPAGMLLESTREFRGSVILSDFGVSNIGSRVRDTEIH